MSLGKRILLGIIFGCAFAAILLWSAFNLEMPTRVKNILLWNVSFFVKLAGNGPLLGYDQQGNPMYEGTPVHILFYLIGIISTFPYYSIIFFLLVSIWSKLKFKSKAKRFDLDNEKNLAE